MLILAGVRIVGRFLDVLDGHHPAQMEVRVHDQELFNAMLPQPIPGRPRGWFLPVRLPVVPSASMMVLTGASRCVSKRRSRCVTMPTRSSPSTTGTPEILSCTGQLQHLAHAGAGMDGQRLADHPALVLLDSPAPVRLARQCPGSCESCQSRLPGPSRWRGPPRSPCPWRPKRKECGG